MAEKCHALLRKGRVDVDFCAAVFLVLGKAWAALPQALLSLLPEVLFPEAEI